MDELPSSVVRSDANANARLCSPFSTTARKSQLQMGRRSRAYQKNMANLRGDGSGSRKRRKTDENGDFRRLREDQFESNAVRALESILLSIMRNFSTRSARFMDAYCRGLNGRQAARASRKVPWTPCTPKRHYEGA